MWSTNHQLDLTTTKVYYSLAQSHPTIMTSISKITTYPPLNLNFYVWAIQVSKQELLKNIFSLFDDMTLQRLLVMGMGVYLEKMEKNTQNGVANMSHIQTTQFTRKKIKKKNLSPKLATTLQTCKYFIMELNATNGIPF